MDDNLKAVKEQAYQAFSNKDYEKAVSLFKLLVDECKNTDPGETLNQLKNDLAVALMMNGQPQDSLPILMEIQYFYTEANNMHQLGLVYGNLATAYELLNSNSAAIDSYKKSVDCFEQSNSKSEKYIALKAIAVLYMKQRKIKDAVWTYIQATNANPKKTLRSLLVKFSFKIFTHS